MPNFSTFRDETGIDWCKKRVHKHTCGAALRPAVHKCPTAIDTPVLRCPECNRTVIYSDMAFFIRCNKNLLNTVPEGDVYYEDVAREALKEEGM